MRAFQALVGSDRVLSRVASRYLLLAGLAGIAALLPVWVRMIVSPAPQEMREGALVWSTIALLHGQNPYAIDSLPGPANVYGPLYPLLVTPLAWLIGPTLTAHRAINNAGIVIACGLLYRVLRREGISPLVALAGAAINFAGLLYWVGPTARPDGIGMALLIGAYAVMAPDPAEPRRFATGLLLSLLGLPTKIYFVLPILVAVAWITWRHGLRRGLVAGSAAATGVAIALVTCASLFPAWAPIVLGANLAAATYDIHYLLQQTQDWALFSLPLLVALIAGALASARRWRHLDGPGVDLWTVALAAGTFAIAVKLGGHRGAHMTYFFHLVTPPLTIIALRLADPVPLARLAFAASLVTGVALNAHWFSLDVDRIARAEQTFQQISDAIGTAERPTATGEIAPLLLSAGIEPVESGHTAYFRVVPPPWYLSPLWAPLDALKRQERLFTRSFYKMVDGRQYDLVIANRRALDLLTPQLLASRYREARHLDLDMPWARQTWPVDLWVPTLYSHLDDN